MPAVATGHGVKVQNLVNHFPVKVVDFESKVSRIYRTVRPHWLEGQVVDRLRFRLEWWYALKLCIHIYIYTLYNYIYIYTYTYLNLGRWSDFTVFLYWVEKSRENQKERNTSLFVLRICDPKKRHKSHQIPQPIGPWKQLLGPPLGPP